MKTNDQKSRSVSFRPAFRKPWEKQEPIEASADDGKSSITDKKGGNNGSKAKKVPTIVVYIDADNISWRHSNAIRAIASQLGTIRKAIAIGTPSRFEGKTGWHTQNWIKCCPVSTIGKKSNAADFEMTMRMGEDVASNHFDAFCIVADDRDYITAAERLKSRGKKVYGLGRGSAPEEYRKILTNYFDLTKASKTRKANGHPDSASSDFDYAKSGGCDLSYVESDGCLVWSAANGEPVADFDLCAQWD